MLCTCCGTLGQGCAALLLDTPQLRGDAHRTAVPRLQVGPRNDCREQPMMLRCGPQSWGRDTSPVKCESPWKQERTSRRGGLLCLAASRGYCGQHRADRLRQGQETSHLRQTPPTLSPGSDTCGRSQGGAPQSGGRAPSSCPSGRVRRPGAARGAAAAREHQGPGGQKPNPSVGLLAPSAPTPELNCCSQNLILPLPICGEALGKDQPTYKTCMIIALLPWWS